MAWDSPPKRAAYRDLPKPKSGRRSALLRFPPTDPSNVRLWHECDIARSQMDVRFRGKSGRAADIIGTTEFDPTETCSADCDRGLGRRHSDQRTAQTALFSLRSAELIQSLFMQDPNLSQVSLRFFNVMPYGSSSARTAISRA